MVHRVIKYILRTNLIFTFVNSNQEATPNNIIQSKAGTTGTGIVIAIIATNCHPAKNILAVLESINYFTPTRITL